MKKAFILTGLIFVFLGLQLKPAQAEACILTPCEKEWDFDINIYANIGYAHPSLKNLNDQLIQKEFTALNENMFLGGGNFQFIFQRIVTELEFDVLLTPPTVNQDFLSWMSAGTFLVNAGYMVKPTPNLSIYPIIGLGAGFLDLSFTKRNLFLSFNEFLANPGQQGRISNLMFVLNAGLGLDYKVNLIKNWGFHLGLRGGYLWTPIASNWWQLNDILQDNEDNRPSIALADGPAMSLTGPYIKLMIGF